MPDESDLNREIIILDVVAPKKDFLSEGGIFNAITALEKLNLLLDTTNEKFAKLGGEALGGIKASMGSGIAADAERGIAAMKALEVQAERTSDSLLRSRSKYDPSTGTYTRQTAAFGSGAPGSSQIIRHYDKDTGAITEEYLQTSEGAARRRREADEAGAAQAARLEAEKREALRIRGASSRAMDDIDPSGLGLLGRAGREMTAEERVQEQQVAARRRREADEAGAAQAARLEAEKREALRIRGASSRAMDDIDPSGLGLLGRAGREMTAEERVQEQQVAARRRREADEAGAAQAARLEAEKREALRIRGASSRAMDDIDPSGLGLLGRAGREMTAEERVQEQQVAARRRGYGREMSQYEAQRQLQLSGDLGQVIGKTPTQRAAARAALMAGYHGDIAGKAFDLQGRASGAGDDEQAATMGKKHAAAMLDSARATATATSANQRFDESTRLIGKNMLQNIKHVTTWAASVGVLYGTLGLLTRSLEENVRIGRQMAILSQVFKGSADAVSDLTNKVLALAAANGQNAGQALEAATEFARVYHTENEILAATNSALVLANVSGEEAGRAVEFLAAMSQVYKMRATELAGAIGQMAYASQNFNVTNQDLMKGLEATAESAKMAGISFSQLVGFISAGVGATGQSGTSVGNTIKTMIQEMANPEVQQKMRGQGIEVTRGGVGLEEMPKIFEKMFVAYERMSDAEKRSMMFNVAGRQNATRMAAILDNYVQSQIIAIQSQLNLNAAQSENEKIMATLSAQTGALVAEWDRFVKIQGDHGPMQALTGMAEALKNLLALVNMPGINMLLALTGAAVVAGGARLAMTGVGMDLAKEGVKGGLLSSTIQAGRNDIKALGIIMAETAQIGQERLYGALVNCGLGGTKMAAGLLEASTAAKAAGLAFATLSDVVLPLVAISAVIWAVNRSVKAFSSHDGSAGIIDTLGGQAGAARSKANLFSVAAGVISDPRTSQEERDRMISQLGGMGVDVSKIGVGGLRDLAKTQAGYADVYSRRQIEDQSDKVGRDQAAINKLLAIQRKDPGATDSAGVPISEVIRKGQDVSAKDQQSLTEMQSTFLAAAQRSGAGYVPETIRQGLFGSSMGALSGGIGGVYGDIGAITPLDEHRRNLAQLKSQFDLRSNAFNALGGMPQDSSTPEGKAAQQAWKEAQDAMIDAGKAFQSQNTPGMEALATRRTRNGAESRYGTAQFQSGFQGLTEGEQMATADEKGKSLLGTMHSIDAEHAVEMGLIENKQKALEKILDLDKERFNTAQKINLEYARGLLTSSPSELLRKLAVNQLSGGKGGTMSAGSFWALSGEARGDYLKLHPWELTEINRSQNALINKFDPGRKMTASRYGQLAVDSSFTRDQYRNVAGPEVSDLGSGIMSKFGGHVSTFGTYIKQFGSIISSLMKSVPQTPSPHTSRFAIPQAVATHRIAHTPSY